MKIVIDIPDEEYNTGQLLHYFGCYSDKLDLVIYNGTPLPKGHGDLIDRTKLYNQTAEWQAQALEQVNRYNPKDSRDEWRWWSAVLNERGAFKHDVADAPTIIEADKGE